ncbi:hypothetical protein [Pelagibius marinus]|uniref:hypothetical protein n=1 Tax=Pelagibius marinus TaxID=2762760 RepID=UPI001872A9DE|nr:hypothetical protein [Pelagibius marinus]
MSRVDAAPALVHPTAHLGGAGVARLARGVVFAVVMLVTFAVLLHFHDRFWSAADEGGYAHVAERLLAGESLNGTVQALHLGYVSFANALAFKVFGIDLLSLRYPLAAMTLIQCALAFWLLAGRGVFPAFAGALAMGSLTLVQFLNPTAQWYALFLCVLTVALLSARPGERRGTLELTGFLLVLLFLFRPLSGIFAAMGVFTFLLLQEQRHPGHAPARLARGLTLLMLVGLVLYLRAMTDIVAALLFGTAPALLLGFTFMTTRLGDRCFCRELGRMVLGGLLAAAPLLAYHFVEGTLENWWRDTLASIISVALSGPVATPGFGALVLRSVEQMLGAGGGAALLNGFFWFSLALLPLSLGALLLRALWRGEAAGLAALPIVACFFALVSVHTQEPLYLFFSAALSLVALLHLSTRAGRRRSLVPAAFCLTLAVIGLTYQAGQPLTRGWDGIVAGQTKTVVAPTGLPRADLIVAAEETALYSLLLSLIDKHSAPGDPILALPASPELYFLAQRRNPLRFFNAARGLQSGADLRAVEVALEKDPPRLVFYRPDDIYNTPPVRRLMADLYERYSLLETAGGFEIYLLDDPEETPQGASEPGA